MGDYSLLLDETVILDFKDLDVAFSLDAFFCSRYQDTLIIKSSNKKTIHSLLRSFRAFRDKILNTSVLSKNLVLIVIPDDLETTYMTTRNISFIKDSEYNKIINKVMKRYENTPKENLTYAYIGKHGHPFDNIIREEFSEYIKPFDHKWSTKSAYATP